MSSESGLDGLVPDHLKPRSAKVLLDQLEVSADIGFHDYEIGKPQRLLVTVEIWFDKVPQRFAGYTDAQFREGGFRVVPNAMARRGAYVGKNVVLMPSFVNIGGYVDEGSMVDTWATVGSCAQIGKNVHLSGGVGIGGVLTWEDAAEFILAGATAVQMGTALLADPRHRIRLIGGRFSGMLAEYLAAQQRTEQALAGQPWTGETAEAAAAVMSAEGTPIDDLRASARYRSAMLGQAMLKFYAETASAVEVAR